MGKYECKVLEKKGTCDSLLFEKMIKNGDIASIKISNLLGIEVEILGYAKCHITTETKDFDMNYIDTTEYGLISTGSSLFIESVINYFGEIKKVRLTEIKTKQGKTYKAIPVLVKNEIKDEKITDEISKTVI